MQSTMERIPTSLMQNGNPHQACIDMSMKCAQICQECLAMCLQEDNVKARVNCIKTLQDCAEICSTTACYMSRNSENITDICKVCATICTKCADECNMFQDMHCKSCADVCRQCASECNNVVNM